MTLLTIVLVVGFCICCFSLVKIESYLARCLGELSDIARSVDSLNDKISSLCSSVDDIEGHLNPTRLDIGPEP
jgi:hypothetical protein